MWRWRRGTQGLCMWILPMVVVLILLKVLWPTSVPRPSNELRSISTSAYLKSLHHMSLEPFNAKQTCRNSKVDVLVIVPSSVANLQARQAVRKSWGAHLPSSWPLIFFIGATSDRPLQDQVTAEAKHHGDIAQDLSFLDSYYNLTLKTLSLLSWAQKFCTNATYVLKIDDDVFLNVQRLYKLTACVTEARQNMYRTKKTDSLLNSGLLETLPSIGSSSEYICNGFKPYQSINYLINAKSHEYESYMFAGYLYDGVKTDRDPNSKWYLDPKFYSSDILPPFLSGTAYIMTSNIIPHLLEEAKFRPIIDLEDVYVSGLVGYGLKLKLSHLQGWNSFRPWWDSPCIYREHLTAHGLSPSELYAITQATENLDDDACNGILFSIVNALNSVVSYMFPRLPTKSTA